MNKTHDFSEDLTPVLCHTPLAEKPDPVPTSPRTGVAGNPAE